MTDVTMVGRVAGRPAGGSTRPVSSASRRGARAPFESPAADLHARPLARHIPSDRRRRLQLALAGLWLLDAVLQSQSGLFTSAFPRMLASAAAGNPPVIAGPIVLSARLIGQHPAIWNADFAAVELLLGLGIAWRPTVRVALAGSVAWSLGVWWLGEGLGGVLSGSSSPVSGAPGAVLIYALLALLLWPAGRGDPPTRAVALRTLGAAPARLIWLLLWSGMAFLAVAGPAPQLAITVMAPGEPGWLASIDYSVGGLLAGHGQQAAIVLAAIFGLIGTGILLPRPGARCAVAAAAAVAIMLWVAGQDFGGIFTGMATDPNSGLVLVLLAAAYWPDRRVTSVPLAARPEGG